MKPLIMVSACLAGLKCRYDGKARTNKKVLELIRDNMALPVCPEQLGGLPTPRAPAELVEGKVITKEGADVSENYISGAEQAVSLAKLAGCKKAYLKSLSPSCGMGLVYDGTFTGGKKDGNGIFAEMLLNMGIEVQSLDFDPED